MLYNYQSKILLILISLKSSIK